ncbi:unnamed protein product, partial [Ilex paraguariensis]
PHIHEASLIGVLSDELDEIKQEFMSMRYFLLDVDKKGVLTQGENIWVGNIRDLANEVEGAIDEFMYHKASLSDNSPSKESM